MDRASGRILENSQVKRKITVFMMAESAEDSLDDSVNPLQKPHRKYKIMANFNMVSTEQTTMSNLVMERSQGNTTVVNEPIGIKEDEPLSMNELPLKVENQLKDIATLSACSSISAPSKLNDIEQDEETELKTCLHQSNAERIVPSCTKDSFCDLSYRQAYCYQIPVNSCNTGKTFLSGIQSWLKMNQDRAEDFDSCSSVEFSIKQFLSVKVDLKNVLKNDEGADIKRVKENNKKEIKETDVECEESWNQDIDQLKIKDHFESKMKKSKLEDSQLDHIIINMEGVSQDRSPDIFEESEKNQCLDFKNDQFRNINSNIFSPGNHKKTCPRATTNQQKNEETAPEEVTSSHEILNMRNTVEKNKQYINRDGKMEVCNNSCIPSSIPSSILNSRTATNSTATTDKHNNEETGLEAATYSTEIMDRPIWIEENAQYISRDEKMEICDDSSIRSPILNSRRAKNYCASDLSAPTVSEKDLKCLNNEMCPASSVLSKRKDSIEETQKHNNVVGYEEEKITIKNSRDDGNFIPPNRKTGNFNPVYNKECSKYGGCACHENYPMSYASAVCSSNNEGQSASYRHESHGHRNYAETDYYQKPHLYRDCLPTLMDNPSELIPVRSSVCHQVLFKEASDIFNSQEGSMIQRDAFILPCDPDLKTNWGETRWDIIKETLERKSWSLKDLTSALTITNSLNKRNFKPENLEKFFIRSYKKESFFSVDLPMIAKLALKLPELFCANPWLLKKGSNLSISLTQEQAACLVAHMFFCSYPDRVLESYPDRIDFQSLYSKLNERLMREKLRCLINYLSYVARYFHGERRRLDHAPFGVVTITRQVVEEPNWMGMEKEIGIQFDVVTDGAIEDDEGLLQVDFANRYIGGGALGHGAVQEEIRFIICPELLVTLLLCESMDDNESIFIIGCQRFNSYSGYGKSFSYSGHYKDTTPRDIYNRKMTKVVAIDATYFSRGADQFSVHSVNRELHKAYAGFGFSSQGSNAKLAAVATGNWGCGAFKGDSKLKAVIQILACAAAERSIRYYTFGDLRLKDDLEMLFGLISDSKISIASLYKIVMSFCRRLGKKDGEKFLSFIEMCLAGVDSDDVSSSDEELPSNHVTLAENNHCISKNLKKPDTPPYTLDSDDDSEEPVDKEKYIGGWKTHPQEYIWNSDNRLKEALLSNGNVGSGDNVGAISVKEDASTLRSVQGNLNEKTMETSSTSNVNSAVKRIRNKREEIGSCDYESGGDGHMGASFYMLDNYPSNASGVIESGRDNLIAANSLSKEVGGNTKDSVMQKGNRLPKTLAPYANPHEKED